MNNLKQIFVGNSLFAKFLHSKKCKLSICCSLHFQILSRQKLLGERRPGSADVVVGSPDHLKVASLLSSVCPVLHMKSLEKL